MRIDNTVNFSIRYLPSNNNEKVAVLEPKNEDFYKYLSINHLKDESKKIRFAYTSAQAFLEAKEQLHSTPFLTEDEIVKSSNALENSLTLVPGNSIHLTSATNEKIVLSVGTRSCTISYGTTSLGAAYVQKINDLIRKMLPQTDPNKPPDLSLLTKEQLAILKRMENEQYLAATKIGGVHEYEVFHKIAESFGSLIRFANEQISSIPQDSIQYIKLGLEKAGIDTTKPFYINGQKLQFDHDNRIVLLQEK